MFSLTSSYRWENWSRNEEESPWYFGKLQIQVTKEQIQKGSLRKAGKILGLFCSLYSLLGGLEDFHQYIMVALMAKAIIKCFIVICEVSG